jgi:hypothetical protein
VSEDLSDVPAWLMTPPMAFPSAPVTTRAQELPFGDLHWENFERLCTRLERTHADIECCRLYGTKGQAQEGIDLYSLGRSSRKYRVLQCKRVEDFTPGKIKSAVEAFLNGSWAAKSEAFSCSVRKRAFGARSLSRKSRDNALSCEASASSSRLGTPISWIVL